jgi:hypothetical protein
MIKEDLAKLLDGTNSIERVPKKYRPLIAENGLAVVHGSSDDLCYFYFPQDGKTKIMEFPLWEGGTIWFDRDFRKFVDGKFKTMLECHDNIIAECNNSIAAIWCGDDIKTPQGGYYSWSYRTYFPHATFLMMKEPEEDDSSYFCRGIVFSVTHLK